MWNILSRSEQVCKVECPSCLIFVTRQPKCYTITDICIIHFQKKNCRLYEGYFQNIWIFNSARRITTILKEFTILGNLQSNISWTLMICWNILFNRMGRYGPDEVVKICVIYLSNLMWKMKRKRHRFNFYSFYKYHHRQKNLHFNEVIFVSFKFDLRI